MSEFPKALYHKDGGHKIVANADEAKKVGEGWGEKPNDNTHRAMRKASGAAKTDKEPGVMSQPPAEVY